MNSIYFYKNDCICFEFKNQDLHSLKITCYLSCAQYDDSRRFLREVNRADPDGQYSKDLQKINVLQNELYSNCIKSMKEFPCVRNLYLKEIKKYRRSCLIVYLFV